MAFYEVVCTLAYNTYVASSYGTQLQKMAQEDDAEVAQRVRQARELEKEVVDKIRKDGTFDAFRRRIVEEVGQKARRGGAVFLKSWRLLLLCVCVKILEKRRKHLDPESTSRAHARVWDHSPLTHSTRESSGFTLRFGAAEGVHGGRGGAQPNAGGGRQRCAIREGA